MQRGMQEARETIRGRWFNVLLLVMLVGSGQEGVLVALLARRLFVLSGRFPKTQERTNSRPMVFDHATIPVIGRQFFCGNAELVRDVRHYNSGNILFLRGKTS